MRVCQQLSEIDGVTAPLVLAAGVFDGVHRGHQVVLEKAKNLALRHRGKAWVLTFDPHPLKVLSPRTAPALLTSTPHKLQLLSALGLAGCVVLPFDRTLAAVEPEVFIDRLRAAMPTLAGLVVGDNWTFGHQARGNVELLRALGARHGFDVQVVSAVDLAGEPISSTRIREAVAAGRLDDAARLLGRPFSLLGTVIHGKKLGRQLGFPTANLDPHNEVRPPSGSYAVHVLYRGAVFNGAAYLGAPDARRGRAREVVEVHILDQTFDLYGQDLEVFFLRQLRGDASFPDLAALKAQIADDVEQARRALGGSNPAPGHGT